MPKRSTTARGGAQRNRPKAQKNIELVRPVVEAEEQEVEAVEKAETTPKAGASATTASRTNKPTATASKAKTTVEERVEQENAISTAPKGSAAARLTARRQAAQKVQQRNAATLITAEHFAYVRRDLATIAILAVIMFAGIIVLFIVLKGGA